MSRILFSLIALLLTAVAVVQIRAARSQTTSPGPSSPDPVRTRVVAEGRVSAYPGGEVVVGCDVSGRVSDIAVEEQQRVRKGDLIAMINADDTRAALAEARARILELDADIRLFEAESARARHLYESEVGSRQAWERAIRDVEAAQARRQSARAEFARLEAVLAKARIVSPIDGVVIARHVHRGETVVEGSRLVTVADVDRVRIESEVDEFDTARILLGGTVTIAAEGFDARWRGTVEEIPHAVVNRRLNPPDPSKPIDTRVLLVKIALAEPAPLKLGQRVEVEFD